MCSVALGVMCGLSVVYGWFMYGECMCVCVLSFFVVHVWYVGERCMVCMVYCGLCVCVVYV